MKRVRVLDPAVSAPMVDLGNQLILGVPVISDYSALELSRRLGFPGVTVWKKVQKLLSLGLAEFGEKPSDYERGSS